MGRGGTTALEFALVGSALVLVLMLVGELGWQLTVDMALRMGVSASSRYGVTGQGYTDNTRDGTILARATAITGMVLDPSKLTTTITSYATPASYAASGTAANSTGYSGQLVVYTYTYKAPYLTSFAATILGSSAMTHTASVLVQNEPF